MSKRIAVAMSGGVDSTMAAWLLKKKKYDVCGVFMKLWSEQGANFLGNKCCASEAEEGARRAADKIGIPFYAIDLRREFKKYVVDYFVTAYARGLTPNPCVACNEKIKFGFLLSRILALRTPVIATGHYVRKINKGKNFYLYKGVDQNKDQSYFLYNLTQKVLRRTEFPLGGYRKEKVKKMVKKLGLLEQEKKESQGICFIPSQNHNHFLKQHIESKVGNIVDDQGKVLGKHEGLPYYTLGQRKNIQIGGTGPYYVYRIDYKNNLLLVTNNKNDSRLYQKVFYATRVNWIEGSEPRYPLLVEGKIRYMKKNIKMNVQRGAGKKEKNCLKIELARPARAVMPGQSVVFYQGSKMLGGGVIRQG